MKKYIVYTLVCVVTTFGTSCKKFLDLKPLDTYTESTFYVDENGLQGGLISCYSALQESNLYGNNMPILGEIRGDNVIDNDPAAGGGVRNQIEVFSETSANDFLLGTWLGSYKTIYRANLVLDKAPNIAMDPTRKNQIMAQAKFLRALNYFNLTRFWGNVPLIAKVQSTEEARNNTRASSEAIYNFIIKDLTEAATDLPTNWPDAQRGRVTSYAALSLLGKVYLYQKKYSLAATTLQPVINAIYAGTILSTVPQPTTFPNGMKTSKDVIFAVQYLSGGVQEGVGENSRYRNNSNGNTISLPQNLFENTDNRRALVAPTGSGVRPGKFNMPLVSNELSGDFPIIRCAEVLLLYAEALNESAYANIEAFKALNAVRSNANASPKTQAILTSQNDFRTAIYLERRLELALESDRWFDIVRTNQTSTIFPLVQSFRTLYPVPQTEIDNVNNKTGWQNTGYN